MSDFKPALEKLLAAEGGLVDNPKDPGGITKYGISLRFLQNLNSSITPDYVKSLTVDQAGSIYKEHFWDKNNYTAISNQDVANSVFLFAVNAGASTSNKCLQRCLRAVNGTALDDDGILGFKSMVAVNSAPASSVSIAFKCFADAYYRSLNKPEFIKGWLNRLYQK